MGLLVSGAYEKRDGSVPLWRSVESPSFFRRFGCLEDRMNGSLAVARGNGEPLGDIAHRAMAASQIAAKDLVIPDLCRERSHFVAEAFWNGRNLLVMVSKVKARRFGRGVRVAAS